VRAGDEHPEIIAVAHPAELFTGTAAATATMAASIAGGTIAVVAPDAMVDDVSAALTAAGIDHARATRSGIITGITVVPVSVVKGLELDGVVVVEPAAIVSGELQGLRALYVALTRSTRQLTGVHALPLPAAML
jgi:DNA helicase IV